MKTKPKPKKPRSIQQALEEAGYTPRSYSGRGMCGEECVGVSVSSYQDIMAIGAVLHDAGLGTDAYRTDQLGKGLIIYWPREAWVESDD